MADKSRHRGRVVLTRDGRAPGPGSAMQLADDESGAGRLERVRAAIVEVIGLYANRYHSDFPMLGNFIDTIWQLLVHTSLGTKNDVVRG